jgi:hypothetical protein
MSLGLKPLAQEFIDKAQRVRSWEFVVRRQERKKANSTIPKDGLVKISKTLSNLKRSLV